MPILAFSKLFSRGKFLKIFVTKVLLIESWVN